MNSKGLFQTSLTKLSTVLQGANADQMYEAAKYINAYWFPQQTLETAIYLQLNKGVDFASADAKLVVGMQLSSGSGANMVHEDLQKRVYSNKRLVKAAVARIDRVTSSNRN